MQPPAKAPKWLIAACNTATPDDKTTGTPAIEVDQDAVKARAFSYILNEAPPGESGSRNDTAFRVAARLKDMGADQFTAFDLVSQWAERRCDVPLEPSEVEHVVQSAYKYTKGTQGADSPEADFEVLKPHERKSIKPKEEKPTIDFERFDLQNISLIDLPPRRWILGRQLICDNVAVWIAPGGEGKSTLSLASAFSVITGDSRYTGLDVHETGRVLMINNEDPIEEIARRTYALCQYHSTKYNDIAANLVPYSGVDKPFLIARHNEKGHLRPNSHFKHIKQYIKDNGIILIIADPFLETHEGDENSNRDINRVGRLYRQIAMECNCAVLLIHHTRKRQGQKNNDYVGDAEGGRGASSLIGVARVMSTLYGMSANDAKAYGVTPSMRGRYARLDDAKANLSIMSPAARWYRKESVELPNGDDVGVLVPDNSLTLVEDTIQNSICDAIINFLLDEGNEAPARQVAEDVAATVTLKSIDATQRQLAEMLPLDHNGYHISHKHGEGRGKNKIPATITIELVK